MQTCAAPHDAATLTSKRKHRLLGDGMQQSAHGVEPAVTVRYLVAGGFSRAQAEASVDVIEHQLARKRRDFASGRTRAVLIASVQLVAAVVMVLTGLYTDQIGSLLLGAGLAIVGYRRLRQVVDHTFSDVVLANRRVVVREPTPAAP